MAICLSKLGTCWGQWGQLGSLGGQWEQYTFTGFPCTDLAEIDPWKDAKDRSQSFQAGRSVELELRSISVRTIHGKTSDRSEK